MNNRNNKVYIRLRHRLQVMPNQQVFLKDIAQLITDPSIEKKLANLLIHQVTAEDQHLVVIDIMQVLRLLNHLHPGLEVESVGFAQTIVEIVYPRKSASMLMVGLVCLLLFIGSGLAIMNFHEDVSMLKVHQKIYKMVTGSQEEHPLLLQIPYSLGIGLGMILFFNQLFKKRLNEEPSPLEVEMFLYQQNLDQYVIMHENKEVQKELDERT